MRGRRRTGRERATGERWEALAGGNDFVPGEKERGEGGSGVCSPMAGANPPTVDAAAERAGVAAAGADRWRGEEAAKGDVRVTA